MKNPSDYDRGYQDGMDRWVKDLRNLGPAKRQRAGMIALIHAAKAFMEHGHSETSDYASGFAQALQDKEAARTKRRGFCVSNYAFALSDMAKTFLER